MPRVPLKTRLGAGEITIGSWLLCGYTPVCELMARAGFDWLVVDMEHSALGPDQQLHLIQVIDLAGLDPLVRVGANDALLIKHALDAGARGVVVPMVNTPSAAEAAVRAVHYPPRGRRGVGLSRAHAYGWQFAEYKDRAGDELILIVQIEHVDAVQHLESILDVPGVDGFIVGPYDLSGSLGVPGQWDHPTVTDTLKHVEEIMRSHAKPGGYHVVYSDHAELQKRIDTGYRFIAYGSDMTFLAEKIRHEVSAATQLIRRTIR